MVGGRYRDDRPGGVGPDTSDSWPDRYSDCPAHNGVAAWDTATIASLASFSRRDAMSKPSRSRSADREAAQLGAECPITRRDFVGSSLAAAGTGALLSTMPAFSSRAHAQGLGDAWTGPGGIGDYARANGNTADVVNAAHALRDGAYGAGPGAFAETGEIHDLVVVGAGVAGMSAAFDLHRRFDGAKRCLVLENHAMFGGESRGNLVELDGYCLAAPQGANQSGPWNEGVLGAIHRQLGIPETVEFAPATGTRSELAFPNDHFDFLFKKPGLATTGFFHGAKDGWTFGDREAQLRALPWPAAVKRDLLAWYHDKTVYAAPGLGVGIDEPRNVGEADDPGLDTPLGRWLDTMSYRDYIANVMKLDPRGVERYVNPYLANTLGGAVDAVSAYGARIMGMPGVSPAAWRWTPQKDVLFAYPMGNAIYPRYMARAMVPKAYADGSLRTMVYGETRHDQLDRAENNTRIRLGATVVRVEHDGSPEQAETASVYYAVNGKLHRVRARGVVMACGTWIHRRAVADMPDDLRQACHTFSYAPILVASVAVRHWRFLDKLGITAARWFEGFGFSTNLRRPMRISGESEPLSPDKPTLLSFYMPFVHPGHPPAVQGSLGRQELFGTSFAQFELRIRRQMQEMFGDHGFDAKRDIGAIILNRWGHAFSVPQPGFYFGTDGQPAPREKVRAGFGRIAFGCSELQGYQTWVSAYSEAVRAARQVSG
jgi:spermidine dehydrogenase